MLHFNLLRVDSLMISSHHFLFVLFNHIKLDALFSSILIIFDDVLVEGAVLIVDDDLGSVDERELMLVGK